CFGSWQWMESIFMLYMEDGIVSRNGARSSGILQCLYAGAGGKFLFMQIYLEADATTAVFPPAREAALAVMADSFGNPSSIHGSGLKARAVVDGVRASARRVLEAPEGQLCFTSGATEGIQTSVLSALCELRRRRDA